MKSRPTKAVIPVAGYGTRRLPITKSIEKCMLPILNRPLIDYIVEDCKSAGIKEIIFIISGGAPQLKSYYSSNPGLVDHLKKSSKVEELQELENIGAGMQFTYIEQPEGKYGTAVPVWAARNHIDMDEPFVVLMGDDLIVRNDSQSATGALLKAWQQSTSAHGLIAVEVPHEDVSKYGVLEVTSDGILQSIIEKPDIDSAPSNLINVSKYVFDGSIFNQLESYMANERDGEYMITDIVDSEVQRGNSFMVAPAEGAYLDGGTLAGWLAANNYLAKL